MRYLERLGDRSVELDAALLARRRRGVLLAVVPLVKPGLRHAQSPARDGVRHAVAGPLVGYEHGQAHRVASFTHRTTDRLAQRRRMSNIWSRYLVKYEEIPRPAGSPLGNSVACN